MSHFHEEFDKMIAPEMDKKTMSSIDVDSYVRATFLNKEKSLKKRSNPEAYRTGMEKMRRAIRKIKNMKRF